MNAESVLAIMGDLYETNAKLNAMLKEANEQTRLANLEIDRLRAVIETIRAGDTERIAAAIDHQIDNGPELPFHVNGSGSKAFQ